jgi:hypothetical protein
MAKDRHGSTAACGGTGDAFSMSWRLQHTVQKHARTVVVQMHPEDRRDGSMRSSYESQRQ